MIRSGAPRAGGKLPPSLNGARTMSFHRIPHWALWAALAACALPAASETPCELPASESMNLLSERSEVLRQVEQLPAQCLKTIVRECSGGADKGLLDFSSAAMCSISYEALLQKGFGGDFPALLAWWREERTSAAVN